MSMRAVGIETAKSLAMTGNIPIGANSVTPMPKAPSAKASRGILIFIKKSHDV
jgi:hypothetical protein